MLYRVIITAGVTFTAANGTGDCTEAFPYIPEVVAVVAVVVVVAATNGRSLADDAVGSPCKPRITSVAFATRLGSE
jgi:hypothetical protein